MTRGPARKCALERLAKKVRIRFVACVMTLVMSAFSESRCLGRQRKLGGISRLKLAIILSPIANKYREGKMKSTLKREFNAPEIVAD